MRKLIRGLSCLLVSALTLVFSSGAHSIVIRHDINALLYNAQPETYPSVVSFRWEAEAGVPDTTSLSGTLLSRHWVLTAAHGADEFEQDALRVEVAGVTYDKVVFDAWLPHPCFDIDEGPMDIGLVYFANPPWPEQSTYPGLHRSSDELGKVIIFVGSGAAGTGATGSSGQEVGAPFRNATNTIDYVDNAWLGFNFSSPEDPDVTVLEGISGPGDSGGPAFMCEELSIDGFGRLACHGDLTLLGVSSHQFSDDVPFQESVYGVMERYARVSTHATWIDMTMTSGTTDSCEPGLRRDATSSPESVSADQDGAMNAQFGCNSAREAGGIPMVLIVAFFAMFALRRRA